MASLDYRDKYFWFIDDHRLAIVEKKTTSNNVVDSKYQSPTTAGLTIRLFYVSRPIPFDSDLSKSSEIPDQFHEALTYKVISDLYKLPGDSFNLQLAAYYDQQYLLAVREAKKFATRHRQSGGVITPVGY